MKKTFLLAGVASVMLLASCSNSNSTDATDAGEVATTTDSSVTYTVDPSASTVQWMGAKLTETTHTGTIAIKEGSLSTTNGALTAGNFVIDMGTIQEINNENKEMAVKLAGHLSSPDFFNKDSFPTSTFEIVEVTGNNIKGNLTMKGITKMIEFPATMETTENTLTAKAHFIINRNDWGITWGSAAQPIKMLGDNLIKEDIEFDINLVANK
jgi:polyisoprenoid-binding protein YceI